MEQEEARDSLASSAPDCIVLWSCPDSIKGCLCYGCLETLSQQVIILGQPDLTKVIAIFGFLAYKGFGISGGIWELD